MFTSFSRMKTCTSSALGPSAPGTGGATATLLNKGSSGTGGCHKSVDCQAGTGGCHTWNVRHRGLLLVDCEEKGADTYGLSGTGGCHTWIVRHRGWEAQRTSVCHLNWHSLIVHPHPFGMMVTGSSLVTHTHTERGSSEQAKQEAPYARACRS